MQDEGYIAYLRVSTEDQAESGAGLAAQRAAIVAEAERRGWVLLEFVEDAGFSGKNTRRPGLQRALARLRAGEARGLVCSKADRLSRSLMDFCGLLDTARRQRWALIALDIPADPTTPTGEAMASVLGVFAQLERRLIGERTKAGMAERRKAGVHLGRPSVLSGDVVARIAAERGRGATLAAIADGLNRDGVATAHGGRQWWPATVRGVLVRGSG